MKQELSCGSSTCQPAKRSESGGQGESVPSDCMQGKGTFPLGARPAGVNCPTEWHVPGGNGRG